MSEDPVPATPAEPLQPRIGLSGAQLRVMAKQGGFAVDEATGNQMITSLEGVIDTLTARWTALQKLGQSPLMSATATAQWVSGHMLNTANDDRGLLTQLQQARDEFPAYVEAIKLAKENYRNREQGTRDVVTELGPDQQS
ncbi:hypothetical protein [Amycolatopsis sp. H20-H5]|uniref:hypothetical protein n=1 Tax=Amycolatopsis sp. H20-H5 TaxID=3046309 RepID=UPI002DBD5081|nr:hypothetical protein [Amycolatopsis sp. H20-H5]MEC3980719.1 hypothetical protein [Amycolatopsis sp. H20-H5]